MEKKKIESRPVGLPVTERTATKVMPRRAQIPERTEWDPAWEEEDLEAEEELEEEEADKAADILKLTPKAAGESVNPGEFLANRLKEASIAELTDVVEKLSTSINASRSRRQQLLRENLERFLSCKTTVDEISVSLSSSSVPDELDRLQRSFSDILQRYETIFLASLNRQSEIEARRIDLEECKQMDWLFQAPSSIRQHIENGEFDAVVREYKRARRAIVSPSEADRSRDVVAVGGTAYIVGASSAQRRLAPHIRLARQEVEKVITEFRQKLTNALSNPWTDMGEHVKTIKLLVSLEPRDDPAWSLLRMQSDSVCCQIFQFSQAQVDREKQKALRKSKKITTPVVRVPVPPAPAPASTMVPRTEGQADKDPATKKFFLSALGVSLTTTPRDEGRTVADAAVEEEEEEIEEEIEEEEEVDELNVSISESSRSLHRLTQIILHSVPELWRFAQGMLGSGPSMTVDSLLSLGTRSESKSGDPKRFARSHSREEVAGLLAQVLDAYVDVAGPMFRRLEESILSALSVELLRGVSASDQDEASGAAGEPSSRAMQHKRMASSVGIHASREPPLFDVMKLGEGGKVSQGESNAASVVVPGWEAAGAKVWDDRMVELVQLQKVLDSQLRLPSSALKNFRNLEQSVVARYLEEKCLFAQREVASLYAHENWIATERADQLDLERAGRQAEKEGSYSTELPECTRVILEAVLLDLSRVVQSTMTKEVDTIGGWLEETLGVFADVLHSLMTQTELFEGAPTFEDRLLTIAANASFTRVHVVPPLLRMFALRFSGSDEQFRRKERLSELFRQVFDLSRAEYVRGRLSMLGQVIQRGVLLCAFPWNSSFFPSGKQSKAIRPYVLEILNELVLAHARLMAHRVDASDVVLSRLLEGILSRFLENAMFVGHREEFVKSKSGSVRVIPPFDADGALQLWLEVSFICDVMDRWKTTSAKNTLYQIEMVCRVWRGTGGDWDAAGKKWIEETMVQQRQRARMQLACFVADK